MIETEVGQYWALKNGLVIKITGYRGGTWPITATIINGIIEGDATDHSWNDLGIWDYELKQTEFDIDTQVFKNTHPEYFL